MSNSLASVGQRLRSSTQAVLPEAAVPEITTPEIGFKIRPLRELWFEESLPASLYQYFTGNTKQKQAERAKEKLKDLDPKSKEFKEQLRVYNKYSYLLPENKGTFDASEVAKFIISNPSFLGSELVNAVLADPYLLFIPVIGWARLGQMAVKATGATTKAGIRASKAGAIATAGAGMGVAYGIPLQLGEDADISAGRTLAEATIGATANLAFGAMFGGLSTKLAVDGDTTVIKAAQEMEKNISNMNPKDARELTAAVNKSIDNILEASKADGKITPEVSQILKEQVAEDIHRIRNATLLKTFNWKTAASLGGVGATAGFLTAKDEKLETAAGLGIGLAAIPTVVKGIRKLIDTEPMALKETRIRNQVHAKEITYQLLSNIENIQLEVRRFKDLALLVPNASKREAMIFAMEDPSKIAKDGTFTWRKFNKEILEEENALFIKNQNSILADIKAGKIQVPKEYIEKFGIDIAHERFANISARKILRSNIEKRLPNETVKFTKKELELVKEDGALRRVYSGLAEQIEGNYKNKFNAIRNYITHEWERGPGEATWGRAEKVINGMIQRDDGTWVPAYQLWGITGGLGKAIKKRVIPTYEEGISIGYIPKTNDAGQMDVFDIMSRYTIGVGKALVEKRTIDTLLTHKIDGGTSNAIVKNLSHIDDGIRHKYVQFDHPNLNTPVWNKIIKTDKSGQRIIANDYDRGPKGWQKAWVHEDFLPYIQMVMDAKDPSSIVKHAQNLNFFMKRFAVGASFFHAASLLESVFFTFGPFKGVKPAGKFAKEMFSKEKGVMLKAADDPDHPDFKRFMEKEYKSTLSRLENSEYRDVVQLLTRNGLTINTPEDVGFDVFYATFNKIEQTIAKIPTYGKVMNDMGVKPLRKIFRWFDKVTWERGFTNMKLYTGLAKLNQLIMDNPTVPLTKLARDAAEFANDAYGGQNWARLANEVADPTLRRMAQAVWKPGARPYVQLAMFAPDWTISNIRIAARAFPAFNANERNRNLYGMYLINGALLYATLANGMNYAFSGHSILENKDPTRIDLGNGEVLTFSKQYMEPFHWITDPQKTALKKTSSLTKTFAEIMTNKKYLTTGWSPQITKKDNTALEKALLYGGQVGKKFLPIWVNQAVEEYMEDGLSYDDALNVILGQMGHPKYKGPRTSSFQTRQLIQDPMKALF